MRCRMCKRCVEIDEKIQRLERLASLVMDDLAREASKSLVVELKERKSQIRCDRI